MTQFGTWGSPQTTSLRPLVYGWRASLGGRSTRWIREP